MKQDTAYCCRQFWSHCDLKYINYRIQYKNYNNVVNALNTSMIFDWKVSKLWFISGLELKSKLSRRCWKAHAAHWKCVHDTFMPWKQHENTNNITSQLYKQMNKLLA